MVLHVRQNVGMVQEDDDHGNVNALMMAFFVAKGVFLLLT